MRKINELNQKIKQLESQKKIFSSLENISIQEFIKYKSTIHQINKAKSQIDKIKFKEKEINFWYDTTTKSWIENPKINCRKFSRLQKRATYKKNLNLYKLGVLNQKPLPPLLENLEVPLDKINTLKSNYFQNIHDKYYYFISYYLPRNINKLAINAAKFGITEYRKLRSKCKLFTNYVSSRNLFKYLKNIIYQANSLVDEVSSKQNNINHINSTRTPKEIQFRQSLRFYPTNNKIVVTKDKTCSEIAKEISHCTRNLKFQIRHPVELDL